MSKSDVMVCRRGCCWSPFGVCARGRECACHTGVRVVERLSLDALVRAESFRTRPGNRGRA